MYLRQYYNRRNLVRLAIISSIAVIMAAIVIIFTWFQDPILFRRAFFQPLREIRLAVKELRPAEHLKNNIEYHKVSEPQVVELNPIRENDIKIIADLRIPKEKSKSPAALLLHGSSPWGRKNGLIVWLGYRLWEEGWVVLAPDARGFGDTEDPIKIGSTNEWNIVEDIRRCVDFLTTQPSVDPDNIIVFGHSMGAGHALQGTLFDDRISRIIIVGPGRHLKDHIDVSHWNLIRFSADRGLDELIPKHAFKSISEKSDFRHFVKMGIIRESNKPILLVDGENEGPQNLQYLADLAIVAGPNLNYFTLAKAGHYCGVASWPDSNHIFVRPDLFNPLFDRIVAFNHQ